MGAASKFYNLIALTTPRVSIEFITQGQNLGGTSEGSSNTTGTGAVFISSTNQSFDIDWGNGVIDTFNLVAGVQFVITGGASGRYLYSSPYGNGVSKTIRVKFSDPTKITRFDGTSWWLRGNLSTAIDILTNLTVLTLSNNNLDSIPANIANLSMLQELGLNSSPSLGGVIPNFVFLISSLKKLHFLNSIAGNTYSSANYTRLNELPLLEELTYGGGGHTDLTNDIFDNIPGLVRLSVNTPNGSGSISDTLPSHAYLCTAWKFYTAIGCYRTMTLTDGFIDNFYTFTITNAAMTGASSLPFRGFTLLMSAGTAVPLGIYQQPAGYVAGSNNGSPASPQEKIWVLVNQYAHTITVASWSVTAITVGATTQITLNNIDAGQATGQLQVGSIVHFKNITGTVAASLNNLDHTITNIAGNVITISTNTTGLAYTSGGTMYKKTF